MADDPNNSTTLGGPATPTTTGAVNRDSGLSAQDRRTLAAAELDNARAMLARQQAAHKQAQAELTMQRAQAVAQRSQAAAERAQSSGVRQELLEQGITPSTVGAELAALRQELGVPAVAPSSLARFLPDEQSRVAAVRSQQGYSERLTRTYEEAYRANVRSQEGAPEFLAAFVNKMASFPSEDIAALHHYAKTVDSESPSEAATATRNLFANISGRREYEEPAARTVTARDFIATQLQYSAISQGVHNASSESYSSLATLAMEQAGITAEQNYEIVGDRPILSPLQQNRLSAAVEAGQTSISAAALNRAPELGVSAPGGLGGGGDTNALLSSLQELVSTLRENTQAVKSVPTLTALGGTNRQTQFRTAEDMLQYYRQTTAEAIPVELLKAGGKAPQVTLENLETARGVFSDIAARRVDELTAPKLTAAQRVTAQEQLQAFGESGLALLREQENVLLRDAREEQARQAQKQREREAKEEERQQRAAEQREATAERQRQDRLAREQMSLAREQQRRLAPRQFRPFEEMLNQQIEMEAVTHTTATGEHPIFVDAQGRIIRDMKTRAPRVFLEQEIEDRQRISPNDPSYIAPLQRPKLDEFGNVEPVRGDTPTSFGRAYSFTQGLRGKGLLTTDKEEYQAANKAGMNFASRASMANMGAGALLGAAIGFGVGGGGGALISMLAGGWMGGAKGLASMVGDAIINTSMSAGSASSFLEAVSGIDKVGRFVAPQLNAMRAAADTAAAMELPIAQAEYAFQGKHNAEHYANASVTSQMNLKLAYELGLAPEKTIDTIKGVAQATGQQFSGRGINALALSDTASLMRGGYDVVQLANVQAQSALFMGTANFNDPRQTLRIFEGRRRDAAGTPTDAVRTVSQVNELSQTAFGMSRARALRGLMPLAATSYAGYAAGAGRGNEQVALSGIATAEQLSFSAGQQALSPLAGAAQQVLFAKAMQENKGDYFRAAEAVQNYTYEEQTAAFRAMGIDKSLQTGMLQAAGMTRLTQNVLDRAVVNKGTAMESQDVAAAYTAAAGKNAVTTDKGLAVSRTTSEEQRAASQRVYRDGDTAIADLIGRLDEVVVQTKVFQDQLVKDGIKKQDIQYLGGQLTSINSSIREGFEGWANTVVKVAGAVTARNNYAVDRSGTAASAARQNSVSPGVTGAY